MCAGEKIKNTLIDEDNYLYTSWKSEARYRKRYKLISLLFLLGSLVNNSQFIAKIMEYTKIIPNEHPTYTVSRVFAEKRENFTSRRLKSGKT